MFPVDRQRVEPRAGFRNPDPSRRAARNVRHRHAQGVGARVDGPHLHVGQFGLERERDRSRAGTEIREHGTRRTGHHEGPTARAPETEALGFAERDLHDEVVTIPLARHQQGVISCRDLRRDVGTTRDPGERSRVGCLFDGQNFVLLAFRR